MLVEGCGLGLLVHPALGQQRGGRGAWNVVHHVGCVQARGGGVVVSEGGLRWRGRGGGRRRDERMLETAEREGGGGRREERGGRRVERGGRGQKGGGDTLVLHPRAHVAIVSQAKILKVVPELLGVYAAGLLLVTHAAGGSLGPTRPLPQRFLGIGKTSVGAGRNQPLDPAVESCHQGENRAACAAKLSSHPTC